MKSGTLSIIVFVLVLGFIGLFLATSWNDPTNVQTPAVQIK